MKRRREILETPNRRRRKKQRIIRIIILLLITLALLATGIFYFFRIPSLQVREVSIIGAKEVDSDVLLQEINNHASGFVFYFIPRTFVLFYPSQEIESSLLEKHNEISEVKAHIRGTSKVEINITERQPEALYCSVNCAYMDHRGFVYEQASATSSYVTFRDTRPEHQQPETVGTQPFEAEVFKDIKAFVENLAALKLHVVEVLIEEGENLSIITQEGKLIVSTKEPLESQLEFLKTALSQEAFKNPDDTVHSFEYIDVRFGKKIFYRI